MSSEFPVVTICGSMTLYEDMLDLARRLTLEGRIVLLPFAIKVRGNADAHAEKASMLDAMHRSKIDMANEVIIVVRDSYIGESTRGEIIYAAASGKPLQFVDLPPLPEAGQA